MSSSESAIPIRLGADKLWEMGFKGEGIAVAFIDSGIEKVVSYEDNLIELRDFSPHKSVRDSNNWHGSAMVEAMHVVAPQAQLGIFKVTDELQFPSKKATIAALQYCIDSFPKYRVVNLSLSFPPDHCPDDCDLCKLVELAYRKGILVTVAAGNKGYKEGENTITCPGRASWALTSIATLPKFQIEFLENMGWLKKKIWEATGKMSKTYGTSYSSAYTAGCAALVFSAFPKLTADTYRHFAISVQNEKRKQGLRTLRVEDVYNEIKRIKEFMEFTGAMVSKPGALHQFVEAY